MRELDPPTRIAFIIFDTFHVISPDTTGSSAFICKLIFTKDFGIDPTVIFIRHACQLLVEMIKNSGMVLELRINRQPLPSSTHCFAKTRTGTAHNRSMRGGWLRPLTLPQRLAEDGKRETATKE
jgi:hypothetical protein